MTETYTEDQITAFIRNQRNLREETTQAGGAEVLLHR